MKIAVFGGSFDPPHIGHMKIVQEIRKTLHVNKIFITPTYLNPFKRSFEANEKIRFSWLQKLFEDEKDIEIFDFEMQQKRAVPTIETIEYLLKNYQIDKIYLIIGADNYLHLEKWHRYDELKNLVEFVIATRDDVNLPKNLKKLSINVNISSSKLREKMDTSFIPKKIENEVKKYYQGNK